ncbi:NAD(P)-binding domain-containing protein [Streptomyces sp. NPDC002055]|uniref:flavin-containing monooxygenase n=1 Tax=Streptomyces sp. NPDC002055 TaxID=3154534 RepID=UPI00332C1555
MPDITPTTPTARTTSTHRSPVYVIGGGPGGLATAAALGEQGIRAVVLERSHGVGGAWRGHYDRLELHTTRRLSALPGFPIPRSYGRWLGRDDMVRYLEQYAEHHRLEIVTGVEVSSIERRGSAAHAAQEARSAPESGSTPGAGAGAGTHEASGSDSASGPDAPSTSDSASGPGVLSTLDPASSPDSASMADSSQSGPGSSSGPDSGSGNSRLGPEPDTDAGPGWLLRATGGRELTTDAVVVATGFNHTPYVPDWPGRDAFGGEVTHASRYRNAAPYRGLDVLVIGSGNTGAEIAVDLAEGGASRVRLAVRTPPHIVRRSTLGWPAQRTGILVRRWPRPVVDGAARAVARLCGPDLTRHGLPRPDTGLSTRARDGAIPVQDVGLVRAVRSGRVEPVAAVHSFEHDRVILADGTTLAPDVVIAATGYRRGLEELVGHLDVLDQRGRPRTHGRRPAAPGLYFTGYTNPISGMLRELSIDAGRIAHAVRREEARRELNERRAARQGRQGRQGRTPRSAPPRVQES